MLTPIRVRGRRKKRHHGHDIPATTSRPKRPGRPLMSLEGILSSSRSRSSKRARLLVKHSSRHRRTPKQKLSLLEQLPVELIEKIFLTSLNVNLPRCSPSLAAAVSSERIYRALILLAFWNDDAAVPTTSSTGVSKILRPLEYHPLSHDDRKNLQTTILTCRWCTLDRLLRYLPDLVNLTVQRHWFDAGMRMSPDEETRLSQYLSAPPETPELTTFEGTNGTANTPHILTVTPPATVRISCPETEHHESHPALGMLVFPEKLLRGDPDAGFSGTHLRYLETLRVASGFNRTDLVHTPVALSRPALQEGIHTALVEDNHRALTILLKIDEYVFRSEHTTLTTCPPYVLPGEHFRTAVRVARNDPACFQLLLRASAESLPPDDPDITQWAMDLHNAFGRWLLDFMVRLPQQVEAANANPADAAVFYLGRANAQVEPARRYLNDVLGVEELPSWMEETFDATDA
ncbi:hypothetical protein BDV59DRAFT_197537 [Aspergillus ambiguus]|uniref:uncharacterized protein n=1 Tax=Aspergillus ambiguus TaxID=176160 RepID=UPI003CCD2504